MPKLEKAGKIEWLKSGIGDDMKMEEALSMINSPVIEGYMVHFERRERGFLVGDYFPDKHAGEELIKTEDEAWELARKFADKMGREKVVNVYVIKANFSPVDSYSERKLLSWDYGYRC